ncbi:nuclease-related domain-containing protein [Salipaludibacillus sp. HK11]|uniref:nuclease-related domain-containing protein n=1 Tax=Salipaludibacillus sp. HK11 TaxID=3394320 RepID=UPI0039FC2ACD
MAQLVKLSDYVSRYEIDIYRYPSRYVRLKKERWQKIKQDWEVKKKGHSHLPQWNSYEEDEKEGTILQRSWNKLRRKIDSKSEDEINLPSERDLDVHSIEQLKQSYRHELFQFQLNWASSTVSEISEVKRSYYYDSFLHFLVTNLPDTYFIFYEPILVMKKAPVELDVIILTPTEIWIIKPLLGDDQTIFKTETDRFWIRQLQEKQERFLHPYLSLNRMRTVLESILQEKGLQIPIKQIVLAKDSFIDIPPKSTRVEFVDKRNFLKFHESLLKNHSPIKNVQLKIADILLAHTLTTSENRELGESPTLEE